MFGESWNFMVWNWKQWFLVPWNGRIYPKFDCLGSCKGSNEMILTFLLQTHVKLPKTNKKVGSIHAYLHRLDFHSKKTLKSRFWQNKQNRSFFYWLARSVFTQTLQGIMNFLGAGGGRHTFGPWRKIHIWPILTWKNLRFKKFLFVGNTLAHGHIGANEKDFLPHQPNELCTVLSTWSKPLK